jgi:uncharacterized repeat protein (TIGR03803 family)
MGRLRKSALACIAAGFMIGAVGAQAQTYKVIHTFTGRPDGEDPTAGLARDGAGNLYGTATYGGSHSFGTVYQMKRAGSNWVFNPLYSFAGGSDGANPVGRVIFGPDGLLYGTTASASTVFKLRPSPKACTSAICTWTETVLYQFQGAPDGLQPQGDLIFDQMGNIYGATFAGGYDYSGTVYQLKPSGNDWTESVLYRFSGSDGQYPENGVVLDSANNLYGTTYGGGLNGVGTVFELTYLAGSGWTESFLYSFGNGSDGGHLYAGLIFDQSGNLYGATAGGGPGGGGTVFKLTPSNGSWTYSLVYGLTGGSCGPYATLFMDGAGNIYGTTYCDGSYGYGNVFELSPSNGGWTYTDLYDFTGGSDGGNPISNVVLDANGNLYGTTSAGGSGCAPTGCGVVWEITP